ncbi:MAG TPA: efflux RND transporter periplasmic adaptor subunit [Candidatus Acidoferrum sp.]|nr:efflux RND transporter periplasmic adaptor subunit [Candidatus Acidoferrum sp.]
MTNEQASHQTPAGAASPASPSQPRAESSPAKIAGIIGLLLLIAAGAIWLSRHHAAAAAGKKGPGAGRGEGPPVPVVAGTVAQKDVPIYLGGLGTVQAFNSVLVRARVDGQVQKIAFTEGQEVKAGDLLAQIDPDPFRTALDQAVAKKGQDEAQLANARVDLKRYADLLANEGVTQQQYDTQKALVDQLMATVNADQAAIESAKVQLAYTTITAPIEGRVGIRLVDQGNIVHASDANGIVVITQLRPISVVFTLSAQTLPHIQQEIQATGNSNLTVQAVSVDNATVLGQGTLAVIDNQIDVTTGTYKLKATFPNTDLMLWPGQFVNARLLLTVRKGSSVVPASVIQRGPDGAFAFVINPDQKADVRQVKLLPKMQDQVEQPEVIVEQGLRPGEQVVVDGQYKLQKGSRVKVAEAPSKSQIRNPTAEEAPAPKSGKNAA